MSPSSIRTLFEIYPADAFATVPLGLRVDRQVYGRLEGADAVTGALPREPKDQVLVALRNLRALLAQAGPAPSEVREIIAVYDSRERVGLMEVCWREVFPGQPAPSFREGSGNLPLGRAVELHCAAYPEDDGTEAGESLSIPCQDGHIRPLGRRMGPIVFAPMITAADPCSGEVSDGNLLSQLRAALGNAGSLLEAAGARWSDVLRATVFMNPVDMRSLNAAWSAVFPDPEDRPPHKWVPAVLPEGHLAAVQVMAMPGAPKRQVIELETIRHGDWMTMAAATAGIVTSSRIIAPRSEDAAHYTRQVIDNIETIMQRAGGRLRDVTQVSAFIGQPSYRGLVAEEFRRRLGAGVSQPVLHFLEVDLGGVKTPRLEILGLVREG